MLSERTYQVVCAVLATKSEEAAAKRLGITPQAVNKQLQQAGKQLEILPFMLDFIRRLHKAHAGV